MYGSRVLCGATMTRQRGPLPSCWRTLLRAMLSSSMAGPIIEPENAAEPREACEDLGDDPLGKEDSVTALL